VNVTETDKDRALRLLDEHSNGLRISHEDVTWLLELVTSQQRMLDFVNIEQQRLTARLSAQLDHVFRGGM